MNLYLHGIGGDETNITVDDSLRAHPGVNYDLVLTNPPFGRKSSLTFVNSEGETEREALTVERPDFWATTSNKQLNFLQHVRTLLKNTGRAAIVVPDNVLFEGGTGESVRRRLLAECDVHTLLRLPTGIFYAQGVKANVLFFDRKPASDTAWTKELWIYDLRTNRRFTLKANPLAPAPTWMTSWPATARRTASSGRRRNASTASHTTSWSSETRPTSTSSGSATRAWRTPPASRRPTSSPTRSWRTCEPHWSSWRRLRGIWNLKRLNDV